MSGSKITLSSNVFPPIVVYDSADNSPPGLLERILKFGIVAEYDGIKIINKPTPINPLIVYGVGGIILASVLFTAYKLL